MQTYCKQTRSLEVPKLVRGGGEQAQRRERNEGEIEREVGGANEREVERKNQQKKILFPLLHTERGTVEAIRWMAR